MNWDRLHKITTSRNRFSHSCKVISKASCFLNICVWGVLLYLQVPIPWLVLNISHQYQFLDGFGTLDNDGGWKAWKNLFRFSLAFDWLCVWDLLPCFEISMSTCYIPKWLTIYCQWSTNEGNQHKIEWYSFWLQKGVKFSFGYGFQNLNLRLVHDYACHSIAKMSCTPYKEIWVLTPLWEWFLWSDIQHGCWMGRNCSNGP